MRTILTLDDQLLSEARKLTGIHEKTALVHAGLEALVAGEQALRRAAAGYLEPSLPATPRYRPKRRAPRKDEVDRSEDELFAFEPRDQPSLKLWDLTRSSRLLRQELDREPTAEEIGEWMGLPVTEVLDLMKTAVASMAKPVIGEAEDPRDDIRKALTDRDLADFINLLLRGLSPREELVLRMRFGVGDRQHTRKRISQSFGVTPARIGRIELSALRKCVKEVQRLSAQFETFAEEISRRTSPSAG
jgi:hypothetical protein